VSKSAPKDKSRGLGGERSTQLILGRAFPNLKSFGGLRPAKSPGKKHCLAVSAGGDNRFSAEIEKVLSGWGVHAREEQPKTGVSSPQVGKYKGAEDYVVGASLEQELYSAAFKLFKATGLKYDCIHMPLIAAGSEHPNVRLFPARFSLVQMVRAYADWRRRRLNAGATCRLIIYVRDPSVTRELASGRINITELLNCTDIRFWAEIVLDSGEIERRLFQCKQNVPLGDIVKELNLPPHLWTVEVTPPPRLEPTKDLQLTQQRGTTLQELGVVPGSTLHFRRD
jgi:hypothetical protein